MAEKKQRKTKKLNVSLETMRHSCAHLMAAVVELLYPRARFGIGPAIEEGFYYDFDIPGGISEDDLGKIEQLMKKIQEKNLSFEKKEVTIEEGLKTVKELGQTYKVELLEELKKEGKKKVSFYHLSDFIDLCSGPHVKNTSQIGPFKLLSVAGAYWRGDEKNKMLTRIYGACFHTKSELEKFIIHREEAKKHDHRKLNRVLRLYLISDDLGPGLATLLPNGAIIAEELEKWAKETEEERGYARVLTPHIGREKFFKKSGHVPYYLEGMYPPMKMEEKGEKEKGIYYLKPMNCTAHHLVFKSEPRSYRDLPLRIAEYGAVYRYEKSGELHGLMRVRGPIHQNDAHIFCTEKQTEEEFQKVMELHQYYYDALHLSKKDYFLSFATRDEAKKDKFLGDDKMWKKAQEITLKYIKKTKIPYEIEEGGAAFYGPKIDFNIKTATGKVFSASTNQIDFFIPKAFDLKYTDRNGKEKTPVCIHRAPLGAHVRFIAFLAEHYGGAFPVWLAPVQTVIIPITDKHLSYGQKIAESFKAEKIRFKLDDRSQTTSAKIREAEIQKVPYMLVVGDKEIKNKGVNVRVRGEKNLGLMKLEKFIELIRTDIDKKR